MPRVSASALVCGTCGRRFVRSSDCKRHEQIHDPGATRYQCGYHGCTYSTLQKSNLQTHYSSTHLNKKSHSCNIGGCDKSYGDPSAVIKHKKKVHGWFPNRQNPYDRPASGRTGGHARLDESVYIKGASKTPSKTPSLYESSASPVSPSLPLTPFVSNSPVSSGSRKHCDSTSAGTETILHEIAADVPMNSAHTRSASVSSPCPSSIAQAWKDNVLQLPLELQMPRLEDIAPVDEVYTLEFWEYWATVA